MIYEIIQISLIASVFTFLGDEDMIFHWYRKLIMKLPNWINRPLGSCNLCITGQACFWGYLIMFNEYNVLEHLFFASAGIFLSSIYSIIWYYDS